MKRARGLMVITKKKCPPGAMLTFQKRQSRRGKSRSSGIKTEVRYHVCVCVGIHAWMALFYDERGHRITEAYECNAKKRVEK